MKKYMLMLAVALIASPAWATVTVSVVPTGPGTANITYDVSGEPNNVAAFAIDVTVDGGAVITDVNDFHRGVSVAGDAGYGIFPANFDRYITVGANGDVTDWTPAGYTPVADGNDKGAEGGLGTSGITLELGALYKGGPNAPDASGVLCSITVDAGCTATPAANAIRGGVVLEGAGAPSNVVFVPGDIAPPGGGDCLTPDAAGYADWVAFGKPRCWCSKTQCYGDADGVKEGSPITGYKRVFIGDLNLLIAAWSVLEPPKGPGIASVENGICADFAHNQEGSPITGYKRVFISDLNLLIANWSVLEPPKGAGIPKDCPGATLDPDVDVVFP